MVANFSFISIFGTIAVNSDKYWSISAKNIKNIRKMAISI